MSSPKDLKQLQILNKRITSRNRFMSSATDRCLPFFKILRKESQFEWTEECERAFKDLKIYLGSTPLLTKPLLEDELLLYLVASETTVSLALVKEEKGL